MEPPWWRMGLNFFRCDGRQQPSAKALLLQKDLDAAVGMVGSGAAGGGRLLGAGHVNPSWCWGALAWVAGRWFSKSSKSWCFPGPVLIHRNTSCSSCIFTVVAFLRLVGFFACLPFPCRLVLSEFTNYFWLISYLCRAAA